MSVGRPRTFDVDKALDKALKVFWRKGYEGASLPDLTKAMGINRPSLYAAFGNKEALFRKAIQRYIEGPGCFFQEALKEPTARKAVERIMYEGIDNVTDPKNPRGCLLVQSALACGEGAETIRKELAKRRAAGQELLRERFERAIKDGDLPRKTDSANLARYIMAVMQGLSVQATSGTSRDELVQVVEIALRAWPQ